MLGDTVPEASPGGGHFAPVAAPSRTVAAGMRPGGGSLKGGRTPGGHLPRPTGGGWRSSGCPGMGAGGAQVLRGGGEAGCGAAGLPRGPMWPPAAAALSGAARGGMRRHRG